MMAIATRDDFELFELSNRGAPPWRNFKLTKAKGGRCPQSQRHQRQTLRRSRHQGLRSLA